MKFQKKFFFSSLPVKKIYITEKKIFSVLLIFEKKSIFKKKFFSKNYHFSVFSSFSSLKMSLFSKKKKFFFLHSKSFQMPRFSPLLLLCLFSLCTAYSLRDPSGQNTDEEGPPEGARRRRMMSPEDQQIVDFYMDKLNKLADDKHPEVSIIDWFCVCVCVSSKNGDKGALIR